jgi:hypothetical protein
MVFAADQFVIAFDGLKMQILSLTSTRFPEPGFVLG